jgi:hypothetical protein
MNIQALITTMEQAAQQTSYSPCWGQSKMTHTKKPAVVIALFALLFASCDWDPDRSGSKSISYDLHGTWEHSSGRGKITLDFYHDTIKITGYVAHLQGFAHDVTLEAYTEDGTLYIKQRGAWLPPLRTGLCGEVSTFSSAI